MSTIDQLFSDLRSAGRKALMPFVTAGDPDLAFTTQLISALSHQGCHLCELGIPYSDPVADGPVIQASYTRALSGDVRVQQILKMVGDVTEQMTMPMVTMVSYAIIYRQGLETYVDAAKQWGVAGLIVPDLPVEESHTLSRVCKARQMSLIQLVTPTTPRERAKRIAENSTGFLYYVSVAGITGERAELPPELVDNVGWLRTQTALPICIGFGISSPKHVRQLAPVADGLIVGSAIVRRVAKAVNTPHTEVLQDVSQFVATLLEALSE